MPLGVQPICSICATNESQMWSKSSDGSVKCNECNNKDINGSKSESNESQNVESIQETDNTNDMKSEKTSAPKQPLICVRKSVRNKGKIRTNFNNKLNSIKGKNRRIIFKRCVVRGPTAFATPVTSDYIFFRGQYYQTGDIVSVVDEESEGTYFAQIRGFLQDQYCEKSAVLTWLLPSSQSPSDRFDPSTYFLGPEEDIPRKLESMQFVCHAPSDYYKDRYTPYPTLTMKVESGFIWTRIGPQIVKICDKQEVMENSDLCQ